MKLLPLVEVEDARDIGVAVKGLVRAGIPLLEITLRTPAALEAITIASQEPGFLVGAGSVTRAEQVDQVVDAGAQFIVSPGLSEKVLARAQDLRVPAVAGVSTPTEMMHALDLGQSTVKFFPASSLGGVAGLRGLSAPFPQLRFIPTGGITSNNLRDYLSLTCVTAVGGSWIATRELIQARDLQEITRRGHKAKSLVAGMGE